MAKDTLDIPQPYYAVRGALRCLGVEMQAFVYDLAGLWFVPPYTLNRAQINAMLAGMQASERAFVMDWLSRVYQFTHYGTFSDGLWDFYVVRTAKFAVIATARQLGYFVLGDCDCSMTRW